MGVLNGQGEWRELRQSGLKWQESHPTDANGWFTEGRGAYYMGDFNAAISAWEKAAQINPELKENADSWLDLARAVKANFPDARLKPMEFIRGDAQSVGDIWRRKAAHLLKARSYDELEKTALQLQKSSVANIKGVPFLDFFFWGLGVDDNQTVTVADFVAQEKALIAWRKAQPQSALARLALIELNTDKAWNARGLEDAATITEAGLAKMDAAMKAGARELEHLPQSAYQTPLAFEVMLNWGQLARVGRPFLNDIFLRATKKFPNYMPLYFIRAHQLQPRWFGEPGEWEAMAKARADQIGGEAGAIFYGRVVWHMSGFSQNLVEESQFDYELAQKGLLALQKRRPSSISVSTARLLLAYEVKDWKTAQQLFLASRGHIIDTNLWRLNGAKGQKSLSEARMAILGEKVN